MITFSKACQLIEKNVIKTKNEETLKVEDSHTRIVSRSYNAKYNLPFTDLSAMDGIMVNEKDLDINKKFKIVGESKSGDSICKNLKKNECKLIFTGAPISKGCERVIPKENCNIDITQNIAEIYKIPQDKYIRKKGKDLKKDQKFLDNGSVMNIRNISLAKSVKLKKVKVLKKPKIHIISTGNELVHKNNPLIEPTNHLIIQLLVKKFGGEIVHSEIIDDNEKKFVEKVLKLKNFDLLITSGGISVGKYDIVRRTLKSIGCKIIFDKIALKPGKPTTFGKLKENKFILGLPGNPVSCFVSMLNFFPIFVKSFLGKELIKLNKVHFKSKNFLKKNGKLTTFQRVICDDKSFEVFENQDSSFQNILSKSSGLLYRPPYSKEIIKGEEVEIIRFSSITEHNI